MLEGLTERVKGEAGYSLRVVGLAGAVALSAASVVAFLIAAAFIRISVDYGPIEASLACAGLFVVLTAILAIAYAVTTARHRREEEARRAAAATSSALALADPRIILLALQVVQAIGLRRLMPLLAVGGAGLALASRSGAGRRRAGPSADPSA